MANKSLSDLPEGMIIEVLLRLPVKSLLQCKSVCKPWLSLISNPHFTKSQIQHAINTCRHDPTLLNIINVKQLAWLAIEPLIYAGDLTPAALQMQQRQRRRRQLVNQALDDTDGQDLSGLSVQFARVAIPGAFHKDRFVSCCNGIICLSYYHYAYLWNPSIRKFMKLPFNTQRGKPHVTVGFGYDRVSDEYKLLVFVYGDGLVPVAKVYYVNAYRCREFRGPTLNSRIELGTSNVVVNGVLYFDGGDQLVSFGLHDEVFGQVQFPNSIRRKMSDVLDFEGSAAMVFESGPGNIDLWVLDNVSGELSWTKKFSIEYGLRDLDTEIWISCYLGAKVFYGRKLLNKDYFVYEVLYDYEKKETKYYGLGEEYVHLYAAAEESEIPAYAQLEDSILPVHAAFKYTETLVSLDRFEPVENARDEFY